VVDSADRVAHASGVFTVALVTTVLKLLVAAIRTHQ
jgi:hypothetical protein